MDEGHVTPLGSADLVDLADAYLGPRLTSAVQKIGLRAAPLNGMALGYISWSSEIGLPQTASLADAFAVSHTYSPLVPGPEDQPFYPDNPADWFDGDPPMVTTAESPPDRPLVAFAARLQPFAWNRFQVALRDDVAWGPPPAPFATGRPVVAGASEPFKYGDTGSTVLEFFVVAPIHVR